MKRLEKDLQPIDKDEEDKNDVAFLPDEIGIQNYEEGVIFKLLKIKFYFKEPQKIGSDIAERLLATRKKK